MHDGVENRSGQPPEPRLQSILSGTAFCDQAGEAEGQWVGLTTDPLLIHRQHKKQGYDTQIMGKDGNLVREPIEDDPHVD
jgi:hypothetical protein